MAKVSDIIFCMEATNVEGQGACAKTIISSLNPEYIPGLFTFSIILVILDIDFSNGDENHDMVVDLVSPDGEITVHVAAKIPPIKLNNNLPPEYKGVNAAMEWSNVNFKISGEYTVKVYIDGLLLKEKKLYVKGKNEL